MKKVLILILAVVLSFSVFALVACQQPCENHVDANHDGICDVCEATGLTVTHTDTNHDGKCDGCGTATTFEHTDAAHDGQCDVCNQTVEVVHVDANNDGICDAQACGHEYEWVDALASAKEYVDGLYLNASEITVADYTITTVVAIGGVTYNVEWTITSDVAGQTAAVLGDIDSTTKQQTVDVDEFSAAEVAYKLVAKISDAQGHSVTVEYGRKVTKFVVSSYEDYLAHCAAGDGVSFTIRAYVIGAVSVTSSSKGSLYLQDADGNGYYAYAPELPAEVTATEEALDAYFPFGTEVCVTGTGTVYGGQYEFNKGCQVVKTGNVAEAGVLTFENVTEAWGNANNQGDHEALMGDQNKLVVLEEAIFTRADGNYYYFTVNGVEFNIYKTNYFMADQADIDALFAKFEAGKAATIKGIVSCYSNLYQIYPLDVECISNVHTPELTDAQKVVFELGNLAFEEVIAENCEIELPSAGGTYNNVAITWAFKDNTTHDCATIAEGKLNVTLPSEATTITLVATLTLNGNTETKEFTVKVESSKIDWKVTADALEICDALENGKTTEDFYYFYGTVGKIYNTEYCNFYLLDEEGNEIVVYGLYAPNGTDRYGSKRQIAEIPFEEGDLICLRAQVQKYVKNDDITPELVNAVHVETPEKGTEAFVAYNTADALEICDALENGATTEDYYYFSGVVGDIYNTEYCNFYLLDEEGNEIVVYGLYAPNGTDRYGSKRQIAEIPFQEGDIIVMRAQVQKYVKNDAITPELVNAVLVSFYTPADAPAHTCESVCATCGGCEDADCTDTACATKCSCEPAETVTTIADALAAADGTPVELTGTVTGHYNGYKSNFYIQDEDGNSILVYYSTADANLGDVVKVVGTLGSFNGTKQIAQGSTFTVVTPHVCAEWNDATCTDAELCKVCGAAKEGSEALGHKDENSDNKCDVCTADLDTSSGWILVTDVSTLAAGDKIVVVANAYDKALSTTQNGNNRGTAEVTKSGTKVTFGDDVQVITLEAGASDGTFAFNVGNGYLYAASSSSNYLRTETTLSANSSWAIEIDANGVATIKAQGTNARNWLRYNSNNNLFACYGSGQTDVCIYKLVGSAE